MADLPPGIALPIPLPEASEAHYQKTATQIAGWAMQNARSAIKQRDLSLAARCLEEAIRLLRNLIHFAEPAEFAESSHPREVEALIDALLHRSLPTPFAGHPGNPERRAALTSGRVFLEEADPSVLEDHSLTDTQMQAIVFIRKLLSYQRRIQQAAALPDPPR